jgi:transcriptional regulator with XRE-family HTH domain
MKRFLTPELAGKLREFRLKAGLSQDEIAAFMGLRGKGRFNFVGRLERGEIPHPQLETIVRYLHACGKTLGEFAPLVDRIEFQPIDTEILDQIKLRAEQRARILRDTTRQALKYQVRTEYPGPIKPLPRGSQDRAIALFRRYRIEVNIIEQVVKNYLKTTKVKYYDFLKYQMLARQVLGLARRYKGTQLKRRVEQTKRFVDDQQLDPAVAGDVKRLVVLQYKELAKAARERKA